MLGNAWDEVISGSDCRKPLGCVEFRCPNCIADKTRTSSLGLVGLAGTVPRFQPTSTAAAALTEHLKSMKTTQVANPALLFINLENKIMSAIHRIEGLKQLYPLYLVSDSFCDL